MNARKNILVFLSFIIVIIIVIWIVQLLQGTIPFVDQWTIAFVSWLESSFLYEPFRLVTHLGSSFFLFPFVAIVTILLIVWFRSFLPGLFFGGGIYLTHKFNVFIKEIVSRERPSTSASLNAEGYSFPSGHAMISIVCYGILAYFITKKLTSKRAILFVNIVFSLIVFLIGLSRYVINVHYLTDVLAGFFIGFFVLLGLIYLYEYIRKRRTQT